MDSQELNAKNLQSQAKSDVASAAKKAETNVGQAIKDAQARVTENLSDKPTDQTTSTLKQSSKNTQATNSFNDQTNQPAPNSDQPHQYDSYNQARQKTGEVIDQVQEKMGDFVDNVKEQTTSQITSQLSTQKERAAESIGNVAQMIRITGDQLRHNDQAGLADYTDRAATQVEKISTFLQERDLNDMVSELESFARREPVLFLGGAFTLGLLATRFIKSSGGSKSNQPNNTQALARRPSESRSFPQGQTKAPLTPRPYVGQEADDASRSNSRSAGAFSPLNQPRDMATSNGQATSSSVGGSNLNQL